MIKGFQIDRNDGRIYVMGVIAVFGRVHFSLASKGRACTIVFHRKGVGGPKGRIRFPANARTEDVWSITVLGDLLDLKYVYEVDGQRVPDPYGRRFTGIERWGSPVRLDKPVHTPADTEGSVYDWEGDVPPCIPYGQCAICHIHPREFTKHVSSGVEGDSQETFKGMVKEIPYLKDPGITTMEMMSSMEFEELIIPGRVGRSPFVAEKPDGKLSYRGYTRGYYFASERAYGSGPVRQPEREFKGVVRALHKAGLESVLGLFLDGEEASSYVLDVVRSQAQEYHVDGVRLMGYVPVKFLGEDPYLSRLRLLVSGWDGVEPGQVRYLTEYNNGFMVDMRSFLKGDKDQFNHLVYHIRYNPQQVGTANYMANVNGFTLIDMVFYDIKHNEANGRGNQDGIDYNQSWNCGAGGSGRKRRIMQIYRRQIRNALLMLSLSQGTLLLMMGGELGRTKKRDNNSYCRGNDISWLNWSLLSSNSSIHEFVKHVIRFRKEHSAFHMEREPALMDYCCVSLSDVSYHGLRTWCPIFSRFLRQLGILYCGKYGKKPDGGEDDYLYIALNIHWESHEFALPNLPKDFRWHIIFDTDEGRVDSVYPQGDEPVLENQKPMMITIRVVTAFMGKEVALLKKTARGKAAGKGEGREEEAYDTVRGNDAVYRGP